MLEPGRLETSEPGPGAGPEPDAAALFQVVTATGRAMHQPFDPRGFLGEVAGPLGQLVPHDRLAIAHLDDDGRTFTIFAEHARSGPLLHDGHYTTDFQPAGRYPVEPASAVGAALGGESLVVADLAQHASPLPESSIERRVVAAGFRSALAVPLRSRGRLVGALVATALQPASFSEAHLRAAARVAELIGPFIDGVYLFQRERRRRRRLQALEGLTQTLGSSLDVKDVFTKLAAAIRPVVDFDITGVCLMTPSGRELEILAEVDDTPVTEDPGRYRIEDFSLAESFLAGHPVLIGDAPVELDSRRAADRLIIEGGGRSCLAVPLVFLEAVGGALYFGKRQPHWYDASDVEIAAGIAAQVVLALQHQRLADEARRRTAVEGRARQLEERLHSLTSELEARYGFDRLIGRSPAFRAVLDRAARVAPTETTVLLTGESGTGKELVARAIHHASLRASGPFVALNCAALPEGLLESELFGHERGAFTGAERQKPGRFELAGGGTLFLDEVGELSPAVQAKLLRVLQEREFQRVGGTQTLKADVRLVAATNRDLGTMTAEGRFRDDLYYRLNVFTLTLPPLRERGEDVLLLADHFVRTIGAQMARGEPGLSRSAREALLAHAWPGNIRELGNAIERALILCDDGLITPEHLGLAPAPRPAGPAPGPEAMPRSLPDWERHMVTSALERAGGNRSQAARMLGLTRSQLYTRLKRFDLAREGPGNH